jgi:colicin import membrane protein
MNADPAPTEFAPPPTPGLARSLALAIAAHALLLAMLALGVQWQHGSAPVTVEAELWSELPADAATPPPAQAAPQSVAMSASLVVNEGATTPAAAPDVNIDVFQEAAAAQKKEKQLQDSQMEQEKRRREALKESPSQIEIEIEMKTDDDTGVDGKPLRDPT